MPKKSSERKGVAKRVLLVFMALILLFGGVFVYIRGVGETGFQLNPRAKIDPNKTYNISMWIVRPLLTEAADLAEQLDTLLAAIRELHPNIAVTVTQMTADKADERLTAALLEKNPPDIYLDFTNYQSYFGELQIPVHRYFPKEELATWPVPITAQASRLDEVMAIPLALYPQVYMINTTLFSSPTPEHSYQNITDNGWTWEAFLSAVENSKQGKVYGYVPTSVGTSLLRNILASLGKSQAISATNQLLWSQEDLVQAANVWRLLTENPGTPKPAALMDENCLTLFLDKKAAMIGPLNHYLAPWLWDRALQAGIQPALLPTPQLNDSQATHLVVFRQEPYKGHDHTRAAVELARELAPGLSSVLAERTNAIPLRPTPSTSHLPFDEQGRQLYGLVEQITPASYAYGPEPGLYRRHWERIISPAWEQFVKGQYTPEQFATTVLSALQRELPRTSP